MLKRNSIILVVLVFIGVFVYKIFCPSWITYTNTRLGFSIQLPARVTSPGVDIFTEQSITARTTAVVVLDDPQLDTVYVTAQTDAFGHVYTYAELTQITQKQLGRIPGGWVIHFEDIQSTAGLNSIASKISSPEFCVLDPEQTFENMTDTAKIYSLRLKETPAAEVSCEGGSKMLYSPKFHRVAWWYTGNGISFGVDNKNFDQGVIESFKFTQNEVSSDTYFQLPEAGIQFKVSDQFKNDLVYSHDSGQIQFSTKSLIALKSSCDSAKGALGYVDVTEGSFGDIIPRRTYHAENINIYYHSPQDDCSDNSNLEAYQRALLEEGLSTVTKIK